MPGPRNSKKARKHQAEKDKVRSKRSILKDLEQNMPNECAARTAVALTRSAMLNGVDENAAAVFSRSYRSPTQEPSTKPIVHQLTTRPTSVPPVPTLDNPFITNPGNGPRVKDTEAYLSSFFCPPQSLSDRGCAMFARDEVLTVLEAVLPREVALIVWYNKTRRFERICPACQRLYRLGDSLVDPISGELVDMNSPQIPPYVLREQQLSGICSFPCFFLASYSSHPYTAEVARGAWGLLYDELDAQTRSLLDATDPRTAAILRFGFAAWTPSLIEEPMSSLDEQGLGRAMRMTRKKDLGLGEVLQALEWHEQERKAGLQLDGMRGTV